VPVADAVGLTTDEMDAVANAEAEAEADATAVALVPQVAEETLPRRVEMLPRPVVWAPSKMDEIVADRSADSVEV